MKQLVKMESNYRNLKRHKTVEAERNKTLMRQYPMPLFFCCLKMKYAYFYFATSIEFSCCHVP